MPQVPHDVNSENCTTVLYDGEAEQLKLLFASTQTLHQNEHNKQSEIVIKFLFQLRLDANHGNLFNYFILQRDRSRTFEIKFNWTRHSSDMNLKGAKIFRVETGKRLKNENSHFDARDDGVGGGDERGGGG